MKIPIAIETFQKNKFSYFGLELWRLTTCTFYAIAYLTYLRSLQDQKIIQETERKLLLTEIAFLKAQINPHFLFNTLNFVFEDVSTISPKSGDTILKLAEMMRYSVQSTKLDFAPVINEAEAIDRYIYLQRKRFGERMYVDFHKQGNLSKKEIPPLIMLSLVENAFKYGVFYDAENPIEIFLEVTESEIVFSCKNKIRDNFKETETNAVGITNIRRRLEISYKNNFELENWIDNKNYFVHLRVFSKKMSLSLN
ncbi:MAG: histidine kinase [Bacteroidota bacterium]